MKAPTVGHGAAGGKLAEGGAATVMVLIEAGRPTTPRSRWNRWTVDVTATIAATEDPDAALTSSFEVPVILQFVHEEPRALEEAAPVIEREIGHLDQYLGALKSD